MPNEICHLEFPASDIASAVALCDVLAKSFTWVLPNHLVCLAKHGKTEAASLRRRDEQWLHANGQ